MAARAPEFASATALFVFDDELRILCWNAGAEGLTGIRAEEAVGRECWEVVAGRDDDGNLVCHRGCSRARLVREGRCVAPAVFNARTREGHRRLSFETVTARSEGGPLYLHLLHEAPATASPPPPGGPAPQLTPRQREILGLLAQGEPVKAIARKLCLTEATVRNHVRLLLLALGAHSQL